MKTPIHFPIEPFTFNFKFGDREYDQFINTRHGFSWETEVSQNQRSPSSSGVTACPKGLICLDHIHVPKQVDLVNPGQFITGVKSKLTVKNVNPGFIDAADNIITDRSNTGLQTCLIRLLTTQFHHYLSRDSLQKKSASWNDRVRVALVDLSGTKLAQPDFAGWGSTVAMYGASVPKILALHAAFQLRSDLRSLAESSGIAAGKALELAAVKQWRAKGLKSGFPDLIWLFDIRNKTGNLGTLDFSVKARKVFQGIMHNAEAGELIIRVGFPYMASVTWQAGLFHPSRGGLWLTASYGKGQWSNNPIKGVQSANVTALSAATYFTLLAQGRLVDDVSSSEMQTWLRGGCMTKHFPQGLGLVASKCGVWSDYWHDCALIVRGRIRYVVVVLSRTKPSEFPKYTQLIRELDNLIVRNNQIPRLAC